MTTANLLLGFIGFFVIGPILVWMSRWSHQARQDRRDAERWRQMMRLRKLWGAEALGKVILRAKFDDESA